MTPSLPTLSIALAISCPIVSSELAEIDATCVISLLVEHGLEILFNSATVSKSLINRIQGFSFNDIANIDVVITSVRFDD
jgi:hypothetical protein